VPRSDLPLRGSDTSCPAKRDPGSCLVVRGPARDPRSQARCSPYAAGHSGSRLSTRTFDQLLLDAEEQLWLGFRRARAKQHRGSRGASRERGLASFLTGQLPGASANVHDEQALSADDIGYAFGDGLD
jgi:hypothetical protein